MSKVKEVLKKYGLNGPYSQEKYVNTMENRFKRRGSEYLDLVDKYLMQGFTPAKWKRLYNEKNSHQALSVYISSHVYANLHQEVLNWLEKNIDNHPDSFIELGCENGLLTLCISEFWPNSIARGLDQLGNAINIAKKLSSKYGKKSEFYFADLTKSNSCINIPKSELIIAPFIFHELINEPQDKWKIISSNIRALLQDNGSLLTINRFPDPKFYNTILDMHLDFVGLKPTSRDKIKVDWEKFPISIYQLDKS